MADRIEKEQGFTWTHWLEDEAATVIAGAKLGQALLEEVKVKHLCVSLEGELGAGKTTLSRGILQGIGHSGRVKSPTYTLVEPYELVQVAAYHFDLYRLADPEELEFVGIRDYFSQPGLSLIEWYEKGEGMLPSPDLIVSLKVEGAGRTVSASACSKSGERCLQRMQLSRTE